jgi:hypothetical protein
MTVYGIDDNCYDAVVDGGDGNSVLEVAAVDDDDYVWM